MSSPAAEGMDIDAIAETNPQQALSAPTGEPDHVSSEFVDAPEEPMTEKDIIAHTSPSSPTSEKATSSQSNNSNTTVVSETSTLQYSQTPFDQYIHQVKELCHLLWPSSPKLPQEVKSSRVERLLAKNRVADIFLPKRNRSVQVSAPPKEFLIHRLRGGGYNRIIGITIKGLTDDEPTELILRVPRFDDVRNDREVAVLRFIRHYTTISVPEVKYADFTCDNPLKQRYVIQTRIPGSDLQHPTKPTFYPDLKHEQKCTFAKEFALILRQLHDIMHPLPGLIEASVDCENEQKYTVRHFELESVSGYQPEPDLNTRWPFFQARPFMKDWKPPESTPTEQSTYYFMAAQFGRWRALQLRCDPAIIRWSSLYERLVIMADEMIRLGFLGNNENCICHLDLLGSPRNIMADIRPDGSLSITGILDWDSAVFAPRFVGCAPPMWLWAWNSEEDEDEKHANDTPSSPEDQEIKRIFEETVGDRFISYAYEPEYRLARELFRFAQIGIRSTTDMDEVEELLREWNEIYDTRMAHKEEEVADTEDAAEDNVAEGEVNVSTEI